MVYSFPKHICTTLILYITHEHGRNDINEQGGHGVQPRYRYDSQWDRNDIALCIKGYRVQSQPKRQSGIAIDADAMDQQGNEFG